jgi:hypothetical protein
VITLHNNLDFPEGTPLHALTEVRINPSLSADPEAYLQFYTPTTRDRGWIQVTAAPFNSVLISQHNSGLYLRSAAYREINP